MFTSVFARGRAVGRLIAGTALAALAWTAGTAAANANTCYDFDMTGVQVLVNGSYQNVPQTADNEFTIPANQGLPQVLNLRFAWQPIGANQQALLNLAGAGATATFVNYQFIGAATVQGGQVYATYNGVPLSPGAGPWPATVYIELGAVFQNDTCSQHESIWAQVEVSDVVTIRPIQVPTATCAFCPPTPERVTPDVVIQPGVLTPSQGIGIGPQIAPQGQLQLPGLSRR